MRKRKILIELPCLIPSGGINVIFALIKVLQKLNYQVDIISEQNGAMYQTFLEMGVEVWINDQIMDESLVVWILKNYDEVLANNLQMCKLVYMLNGRGIEVKWWIHEPPMYFELCKQAIPQSFWDSLNENIKIYAAGNIVHQHLLQAYNVENHILNFWVEDIAANIQSAQSNLVSSDKITFLFPSITFQPIKGQDLLIRAIAELPREYQDRMEFIFIGSRMEEYGDYFDEIKHFEMHRKNVNIFGIIEKSELMTFMKQVDCIVAPSRQDAPNSCIMEGMMLS